MRPERGFRYPTLEASVGPSMVICTSKALFFSGRPENRRGTSVVRDYLAGGNHVYYSSITNLPHSADDQYCADRPAVCPATRPRGAASGSDLITCSGRALGLVRDLRFHRGSVLRGRVADLALQLRAAAGGGHAAFLVLQPGHGCLWHLIGRRAGRHLFKCTGSERQRARRPLLVLVAPPVPAQCAAAGRGEAPGDEINPGGRKCVVPLPRQL